MDPKMTVVKNITTGIICCSEKDNIEEATRIIENNQVRRLVVLGDDKTVVDMLSLWDLALKTSKDYLAHEVLERVC
jgi:CBS domain-containing protein